MRGPTGILFGMAGNATEGDGNLLEGMKDAAYVAVGLGLLGFQRAQVRRREVMKQLSDAGVDPGAAGVADLAKLLAELDKRMDPVVEQLDGSLGQLSEHLPAEAREAVEHARVTALAARRAFRGQFGGGEGPERP